MVPVTLGSVTSAVTSAGTLRFVDTVSVGFPDGGKLVSLKVKVGDRVTPGQPLAQVEDIEQRVALRKANATVKIEEAKLGKLIAKNSVETADDDAGYREQEREDTQEIREETVESAQSAVGQIRRQLAFDRKELRRRQQQLQEDRQCLGVDSDPIMLGTQPSEECRDRVNRREDQVEDAREEIIDTLAQLDAAQNKVDLDGSIREREVTDAKREEEKAENAEDEQVSDRPFDIEVQRQILEQARAGVELAQRKLDKAIKPSSYSGTVDGINGRVGQVMAAASAKPLAGKPAPAGAPAGDKLITLKDVNAYEVVVPFPQAEGAQITPEQSVEVSYLDLPGVSSPARIANIEPPVAGVSASYLVTVVLKEAAPELKDGMSARVAVAVNKIDNALSVPASAVRVSGRVGTVTVQQPDGALREAPVELGMIGDKSIQILSGLKVEDQVRAVHPH